MDVLKRHARLLYIIALFQMLGGPLVLGGLLLVTRMAADEQLTLPQKIAMAAAKMQRLDAIAREQAFPAAGLDATTPAPAPVQAPSIPKESKEGKTRLFALICPFPSMIAFGRQPPLDHPRWHDPAPAKRGHAPPIPPPRVLS